MLSIMALKFAIRFPIFAPPFDPNHDWNSTLQQPSTIVRFSRWNNANARRFNERRRTQQEIEDEIRRERRFNSATKIADMDGDDNDDTGSSYTRSSSVERFRSIGTPSAPSRPSIPGKKSKYSKNPKPDRDSHPAFKFSNIPTSSQVDRPVAAPANVKIGEDGVSYLIDGAPFEFKYSYTETPKVKPIKMREAPFVPFGPTTMPRPWTGKAPLPPSKKKLKEFDSFELPPPDKKGVKPVQKPGPFLPGTGPRYVYSREEILGDPLTKEEINDMIQGCMKSERQLNIGRDGLTHNMLDNIHAHWKRRRVCKIKCKGVCTVDMDNVCQQLEERTGGKIIYRRGGVVYLFRGRNYNYKTRPRFPLMLWKPAAAVYPRLIQRVPEGLTIEQATEMRKKGRDLIPICKLAKNGVYRDLVKNVKEAFEECELVRINCQGLNPSDFKKIGAKLRDLVPCVLLSFQYEHILLCRGQNWKSSLPNPKSEDQEANKIDKDSPLPSEALEESASCVRKNAVEHENNGLLDNSISSFSLGDVSSKKVKVPYPAENSNLSASVVTDAAALATGTLEDETKTDVAGFGEPEPSSSSNIHAQFSSEAISDNHGTENTLDNEDCSDDSSTSISEFDTVLGNGNSSVDVMVSSDTDDNLLDPSGASDVSRVSSSTKEVLSLLEQAVEKGMALILDGVSLDADFVYQRTVAFAKSAAPGPVFRRQNRKVVVQKSEEEGSVPEKEEKEEIITVLVGSKREKSPKIPKKAGFDGPFTNVVPQGSLGVDELARLLS
ncbi:hypothetical protein L6164_007929 [Bauhinia variegata]|uniref:Uncharacterized protein n=1 Tax=Bauhinia variegata TaxID=167791 RepID=A0ACB9PE95_BAUVA|nr:hypothetical protein L6164_007929 [Bauhinia variegata]